MNRYCPQLPLPAYRYIPGQMQKDEHRRDIPKVKTINISPKKWFENEAYVYGIDLFNHGFFYEAHEVWEALWMKVDRETVQGKFLKALIQLAASRLKTLMGEAKPPERLSLKARELFQIVLNSGKCDLEGSYMGFSILFKEFKYMEEANSTSIGEEKRQE